MAKQHWMQLGKAMLCTYAVVGAAWWWDEASPLGWWTLKPRTKEEKEMAHLYQRRDFPYPGDEEAVKELVAKGGTYGTTIGTQAAMQIAGDDLITDLQREKFDREARKLWLRMRHEVIREFEESGYDPFVESDAASPLQA
ncbi:hypothetical protein R1sor_022587 [Riccia sorocarpa]|uniref:Uncharacterized protein n=1 Tax=Riccia sorocarpa TaxID=122646 RepID=A0ABD3GP45_9MARC